MVNPLDGLRVGWARQDRRAALQLQHQQLQLQKQQQEFNFLKGGASRNPETGAFDVHPHGDIATNRSDNQTRQTWNNATMDALNGLGDGLYKVFQTLAIKDADAAMTEFVETGDSNVFNKFRKNNTYLDEMWTERGWGAVTNLDWDSDAELIEQHALSPENYRGSWKVYNNNNKAWEVMDFEDIMAETGFLDRAPAAVKAQALALVDELHSQDRFETNMQNAATVVAAKQGRSLPAEISARGQQQQLSEDKFEQSTKRDEANLDIQRGRLGVEIERAQQPGGAASTTTAKNLALSAQKIEELKSDRTLLDKFGAETFEDLDTDDPKVYNAYAPKLIEIEQLRKQPWGTAQVAAAKRLRKFKNLAEKASLITEKNTGLWDSTVNKLKQYVSNADSDVKEVDAAVAALINAVIYDVGGRTLTKVELTRGKKATGSPERAFSSLLTGLKIKFDQLSGDLKTLHRSVSPLTYQFRVGIPVDTFDNLSNTLAMKIAEVAGNQHGKEGRLGMTRATQVNVEEDADTLQFNTSSETPSTLTPEMAEKLMRQIRDGIKNRGN